MLACGRRFGKSTIGALECFKYARVPDSPVWFVSLAYEPLKHLLWKSMKDKAKRINCYAGEDNSSLTLTLTNGSSIGLRSENRPDFLRSAGLKFVVVDEKAHMRSNFFPEVLMPMLAERDGDAMIMSSTKGKNHFHEDYQRGQNPDEPDWQSWKYTTYDGGRVTRAALGHARRSMDEATYRQEYEADFLAFEGKAYYDFNEEVHCIEGLKKACYDQNRGISLCLDFNVAPGVAVICQEIPNYFNRGEAVTGVIGEVHIERNSNTRLVCREFAEKWKAHRGSVFLFGDSTGAAKGSAKVEGSDWDIVFQELRPVFGDRLVDMVPGVNPPVRSRVNALNSRIKSADGAVRLLCDPAEAPRTVNDFGSVSLLKDGSGEIDKKSDPSLTHLTDAVGYYIAEEYPMESLGESMEFGRAALA